MKRKAKKKACRKRSSPRVSTIAAKLMRECERLRERGFVDGWLMVADVEAVAASVLSQDEVRGQK